jgi:hypothetical protein
VESFAYIGMSDRIVCQRVADELAISLTLGRSLWSLARRHNITRKGADALMPVARRGTM